MRQFNSTIKKSCKKLAFTDITTHSRTLPLSCHDYAPWKSEPLR